MAHKQNPNGCYQDDTNFNICTTNLQKQRQQMISPQLDPWGRCRIRSEKEEKRVHWSRSTCSLHVEYRCRTVANPVKEREENIIWAKSIISDHSMCACLFWAHLFKLLCWEKAERLPKVTSAVDFMLVRPAMNFLKDKYSALYQVLTILISQRKNTGWLKCFLYPPNVTGSIWMVLFCKSDTIFRSQ